MNIVAIEDNKNNIVKKHNDLVNKARYSLSESGIKLISMIISMIRTDDETFQEYHLSVNEFTALKGSTSKNDYEAVHQIIKELLSTPVRIGNLQANFIASGEYKEGEAMAVFEISQKLKPYLLQLQKDFLEYNIKDILSLRSSYVIRLYELIIQKWKEYKHYNKQSGSYTFELEIQNIRELFEIPDSFKYNDIKRHIIDKAQKQFEEKTNIRFDYKEQKLGRKVVRIQITVKDNMKGSNDVLHSRQTFIAYVRKAYKPNVAKNYFPVVVSTTKGDLKVSKDGLLYNNALEAEYTREQADKLWNWLYDECIKRGDLSLLADPEQKSLF